jgi:hypothetical protein
MSPIETELSRVLNEAAPEPPEGSGPREFGAVPRRQWVLPVAAAAAVLLIAAIAVAIARHGGGATRASNGSLTVGPPAPKPASGMVSVGYFGITVTVPTDFLVGPVLCSEPRHNSVVPFTYEVASCPAMIGRPKVARDVTIVYLEPESVGGIPARHPTTVDGVPARTGDGRDSYRRPESVLVIPRNQVQVLVIAPTYATAHRVLQNVHVAPVDTHGCADHAARLTADSNPSATAIVPGRPTSATACEYSNHYRLIGSGPLTQNQISRVQRALDRAHEGKDFAPTVLNVRYLFRYADGATRTVDVDLDVDPSAATDGRQVVTSAFAELPRAYR